MDGGAGCLQGLGWRLIDAAGREISEPACGELLPRVAEIRSPKPGIELHPVRITILCDVDNPLTGPRGAARVFAPQKGAPAAAVRQLEAALERWADLMASGHDERVRERPGGGAAGGLPAGLAAIPGVQTVPGFDHVADLGGLDAKLRGCDLCLTGEGRLDEQTIGGKVVAGLARRAQAAGTPVSVFAGAVRQRAGTSADLAALLGAREVITITPAGTPLERALAQTAANLRRAVAERLSA